MNNKATSLKEKVLLVKKKNHAKRTISHLRGAMERKNMLAKIDYKFQK
jgi:hypothetical protein